LREVLAAFDEELGRLPERLSAPVVLCFLQGATQDEGAQALGWSLSTFRRRLGQGRALLRVRLERRGLGLTSALVATLLASAPGQASPPTGLVTTAAQVARGGAVSARAAALADGLARAVRGLRLQAAAALLLVLGLLAAGAGLAARPAPEPRPPEGPTSPVALVEEKPKAPAEGPPADLHGDPLPAGAVARIGTTRFLAPNLLQALVYSPDGKLIAAGPQWGGACLLDAKTGKRLSDLWGPHFGSRALAFSPDGKLLAGDAGDQTLRLWDLAGNAEVRSIRLLPWGNNNSGCSLAFSPDSKRLACGQYDGCLSVWDIKTGKPIARFRQGPHAITTVAFLDGGKVLAGYAGTDLVLRDAVKGKELKRFKIGIFNHLPLSRDARLAAWQRTGGGKSEVAVLDLKTGKELPPVVIREPFGSMALLPDGKHVVVTHFGRGSSLSLWNIATRKEVRRLAGLEPWVWPRELVLAASPDSKRVAAGRLGFDGLCVWDVATGKKLSPTGYFAGWPIAFAVSPDGKIASLDRNSYDFLKLWDAATGALLLRPLLPTPHGGFVLRYSPDGKTLLVTQHGRMGTRALDAGTGKSLAVFAGEWATFSPDGKVVAIVKHKWDRPGRHDPAVRLVAPTTGKEARALEGLGMDDPKEAAYVIALAFSPDGKAVFAAGNAMSGPWARGWSTATGKALPREAPLPRDRTKYPHPRLWGISPDGARVALTYIGPEKEHRGLLCDRATGLLTPSFPAMSRSSPFPVAFSPDGQTAAFPDNGAISVRECVSGLERCRFPAQLKFRDVECLAFSPDGRALVAGHTHVPDALVWDVTGRLHKGKLRPASPSPARLGELWDDLAGEDGVKAHRAVWELIAAPKQAAPFLKERLRLPKVDHKQTAKWVADLHEEDFAKRAAAVEGLEKLGLDAETALRRELARKPSLEVVRRLEGILAKLDGGLPPRHWLQFLRALEALEQIGGHDARQVVERLADSSNESRLARSAQATLHRLRLKNAR
jgi:WD40 repeat protein